MAVEGVVFLRILPFAARGRHEPGLLPPEEAGLPLPPEACFPFHVVRCCASIFDLQYCGWKNFSSFWNGVDRYRHEP